MRRVAVVGGGVAGIVATRVLHGRGVEVDAFERSDRLGGIWSTANPRGEVTAAYDTLTLNSSKRSTQFPDHPMPDHYPDYPSAVQFEDYLGDYAARFGVHDRYRFGTTVEHAARRPEGGWDVTIAPTGADGPRETRQYDLLVAANGHHHTPNVPGFPGTFDGEIIHSHAYRRRETLRGRDAVVLGLGNSAVDIAAEAAKVARSTTLAIRRGVHVLPKYLFGVPLDRYPNDPRVPFAIRRRILSTLLRTGHGRMRDFGLPDPDHPLGGSHPTVSAEIFDQLRAGRIVVKPQIDRYDGDGVRFVDGSRVRADLVVLATGYQVVFPFLDPQVLSAPDNRIALYLNVFDPRYDDLAVMGLVQTVGSNIRMAHAQAQLVGDWATGRYTLPSTEAMHRDIATTSAAIARRYVASPRHTLQVDHHAYLRRIDQERRAGWRRSNAPATGR